MALLDDLITGKCEPFNPEIHRTLLFFFLDSSRILRKVTRVQSSFKRLNNQIKTSIRPIKYL